MVTKIQKLFVISKNKIFKYLEVLKYATVIVKNLPNFVQCPETNLTLLFKGKTILIKISLADVV